METTPPAAARRIEELEAELRRRESQEGRLRQIVETALEGILTIERQGPPGSVSGQPQTLGLRLVNSLVRQLGGELEVRVENGSSFPVRFPLPWRQPERA